LADSPNAILTLWAQKSGIAGLRVGAIIDEPNDYRSPEGNVGEE
jgi:hypothetical protein